MTRQRSGRFGTVEHTLLPGYGIVAFDMSGGSRGTIHSTYGVMSLASYGREPALIPGDIVSQLSLSCDPTSKLLPPPRLMPGDKDTLTKGPLADFVAEIETINAEHRAICPV